MNKAWCELLIWQVTRMHVSVCSYVHQFDQFPSICWQSSLLKTYFLEWIIQPLNQCHHFTTQEVSQRPQFDCLLTASLVYNIALGISRFLIILSTSFVSDYSFIYSWIKFDNSVTLIQKKKNKNTISKQVHVPDFLFSFNFEVFVLSACYRRKYRWLGGIYYFVPLCFTVCTYIYIPFYFCPYPF